MNIFRKLFGRNKKLEKTPFDFIAAVKRRDLPALVTNLASDTSSSSLTAIPYTREDIINDLDVLDSLHVTCGLTEEEFIAAATSKMLHFPHRETLNYLSSHGYVSPSVDRLIYLSTYMHTMETLKKYTSIGIKKFQVRSCGDERVCSVCSKQDKKIHLVSKAVIGKTAPPFCESCRCIILPIWGKQ